MCDGPEILFLTNPTLKLSLIRPSAHSVFLYA